MKGEHILYIDNHISTYRGENAPSLSFKKSKAECPKHLSKEDRKDIMVFQTFNVFPCAH